MSSMAALHGFCLRVVVFSFISSLLSFTALSSSLHPLVAGSAVEHRNHTGISEFRLINRRSLVECPDVNPYVRITTSRAGSKLSDDEYVTVNVSGILVPSKSDWVAMISPSISE